MLYATSRMQELNADHASLMFNFAAVIERKKQKDKVMAFLRGKLLITQTSVYPNLLEWSADQTTDKQDIYFITLYGPINGQVKWIKAQLQAGSWWMGGWLDMVKVARYLWQYSDRFRLDRMCRKEMRQKAWGKKREVINRHGCAQNSIANINS